MMENKNKISELEATLTEEEKAALAEIEGPAKRNVLINDELFKPSYEKIKQYKTLAVIAKILTYAFLTFFAFIMLAPFIFMVSTSMTDPTTYNKLLDSGTVSLITQNPSLVNFRIILGGIKEGEAGFDLLPQDLANIVLSKTFNFVPFFINTFIVAIVSTLFTTITTVMTAFAFARLEFKAKDALFALLLATMMVPGEMMLITNYSTVTGLFQNDTYLIEGLRNTFFPLIFVHGVSVFYIFQLRQTFQQIPNELFLAAKVDGYGEFRYLWRVMIPLGMPTIVTIIILNVMGSWNAYVWPNLIAPGTNPILKEFFDIEWSMQLVSNGLMGLFSSDYRDYDTVKIAGSMIISAPLFVAFIFFRKYIMRGVSRSGIKG
jgi:multiple sugar transport system permease protein